MCDTVTPLDALQGPMLQVQDLQLWYQCCGIAHDMMGYELVLDLDFLSVAVAVGVHHAQRWSQRR